VNDGVLDSKQFRKKEKRKIALFKFINCAYGINNRSTFHKQPCAKLSRTKLVGYRDPVDLNRSKSKSGEAAALIEVGIQQMLVVKNKKAH